MIIQVLEIVSFYKTNLYAYLLIRRKKKFKNVAKKRYKWQKNRSWKKSGRE